LTQKHEKKAPITIPMAPIFMNVPQIMFQNLYQSQKAYQKTKRARRPENAISLKEPSPIFVHN
jgi:hypothetical protein